MVRRFSKFKDVVLLVHRTNNADLPYKLGMYKFTDGKLMEKCANSPHRREAMLAKKVGNSSVLWEPDDGFLREVFADFKVVNGKLFVVFPVGKAEAGGGLKEVPLWQGFGRLQLYHCNVL
ncbi:hypothetical protein BAE44_0014020 [Dichanthelium oligosanthes]|uniref:Uncharacterized protein n=1 Tax=Dichanthelium oligosanthes TaxID=888268 RepID=A0A1E5VIP3_9POAL|nr:hypothetical protein BAE44_0014020 [Dichanthelium oligosanthes]